MCIHKPESYDFPDFLPPPLVQRTFSDQLIANSAFARHYYCRINYEENLTTTAHYDGQCGHMLSFPNNKYADSDILSRFYVDSYFLKCMCCPL